MVDKLLEEIREAMTTLSDEELMDFLVNNIVQSVSVLRGLCDEGQVSDILELAGEIEEVTVVVNDSTMN